MSSRLLILVLLAACAAPPADSTTDLDLVHPAAPCSPSGWCWQAPPQTGNKLFGIAAVKKRRVIVGDAETFLETTDGTTLRGTTGTAWDAIKDVWSDPDGGAWAVGRHGTIWKRVGPEQWTRIQAPINDDFVAIYGTDREHIWAVSAFGYAVRFDGTSWTNFETGIVNPDTEVGDVWASGPSDVWITGRGFVRRWDGQTWHGVGYSAESNPMLRVWGSGNDVWIGSETNPGILKVDRATDVANPVPEAKVFYGIIDISGTGPNDVWFAGPFDLLHFDGSSWTSHAHEWGPNETFLPDGMRMFRFNSVRAISKDEAWMLGDEGALARYDGQRWIRLGNEGVAVRPLTNLLARSSNDLWAFGIDEIRRFDGHAWSVEPIAFSNNASYGGIRAVTLTKGEIIRVDRPTKDHLEVRKLDKGNTWQPVGTPFFEPTDCTALWASAPDDIWVAAEQTVYRWDGAQWSTVELPGIDCHTTNGYKICTQVTMGAIHGRSKNDVWVLGRTRPFQHVLYRLHGTTWTMTFLAKDELAFGIFDGGSDRGWIGGEGKLFEVDHDTIRDIDLPGHEEIAYFSGTNDELYAVGGSGYSLVTADQVFVERRYGYVIHYDGTTWREEKSGSGLPIEGIARTSDGTWLLTGNGLLRKR